MTTVPSSHQRGQHWHHQPSSEVTVYYDEEEQSGQRAIRGSGHRAKHRDVPTALGQLIFQTAERESFDVLGQYFLSELERDSGGDTFNEGNTFGVGGFLQHGRNTLFARVLSSALKGNMLLGDHQIHWGVKQRFESFDDVVSEWNVVDSAGFFAPHPPDNLGYNEPGGRPDQYITLPYVVDAYNLVSTTAAPPLFKIRGVGSRAPELWISISACVPIDGRCCQTAGQWNGTPIWLEDRGGTCPSHLTVVRSPHSTCREAGTTNRHFTGKCEDWTARFVKTLNHKSPPCCRRH